MHSKQEEAVGIYITAGMALGPYSWPSLGEGT